jgi:hypothetical protein
MVGEWIWTKAAFGDFADNAGYFEIYRDNLEGVCYKAGCSLDDLRRMRETVAPQFIDFCMERIDWSRFGLIGFSVVFQQTLASVALAKALKKRYPHIPIMMGGATFEDDIAEEIMKGCPQVDYIHCGDAMKHFPLPFDVSTAGNRCKACLELCGATTIGSFTPAGRQISRT